MPPWCPGCGAGPPKGSKIAGVCSGVALLAEAGLLDGKRATTHWALTETYRRSFPNVDWQPDYLITDAGDVFCGGGINSAADLGLYLVERFSGRKIAIECAKALLIEMPRTWQAAFAHVSLHKDHRDEVIQQAQDWLHEHIRDPIGVDALAARVAMSRRNFARRFKDATGQTPLSYIQSMRIQMAKQLLEGERRTVQEVSLAVGYEDVIFFRGLFKRHTGICPNEYRHRFGASVIARAAGARANGGDLFQPGPRKRGVDRAGSMDEVLGRSGPAAATSASAVAQTVSHR